MIPFVRRQFLSLLLGGCFAWGSFLAPAQALQSLEKTFRTLPSESRSLVGPLFWLHGSESRETICQYVEKIAQGGNGCFTVESRPHSDWLGERWFEDLGVCLEAAQKHGLQMWIFDEKWWPSGEVGGQVPEPYRSKWIEACCYPVPSGSTLRMPLQDPAHLIGVLAAKSTFNENQEVFLSSTLTDVTETIRSKGEWTAPEKDWKLIVFTWKPNTERPVVVDGLSQDAVDWYIQTVYQPHYERFKDEFGKTIQGFFFDEPETCGDYGYEILPELERRGLDWAQALMAWKFSLEEPQQTPYRYAYHEVLAQTWGKLFYQTLTQWCEERKVRSIGHWLEHRNEYRQMKTCAGNMFELMRHQSLAGIDAVFTQFKWGERVVYDAPTWQTPKMASSVSHTYGKKDDLAMVEIFGARGQDISYPEMKWWCDAMQVAGVNFMIPHSFNPRSPYDQDCPPYFYNKGFEPRWPLYRVWADYSLRLSTLLTGGHHVCDIALLYPGNSFHLGQVTPPEGVSEILGDQLYDCDWLTYDALLERMQLEHGVLTQGGEKYKMLIIPPIEVIPYEVLGRVKDFYDQGGAVLAYDFLPTRSASLGKGQEEIAALRAHIWGENFFNEVTLNKNAQGGKAWFMKSLSTNRVSELRNVLAHSDVEPVVEVLTGETDGWVHALHRVKEGMDVYFIVNQNCDTAPRHLTLRVAASQGYPEIWDAMRCEITRPAFSRVKPGYVDLDLSLSPNESVLLVFNPEQRPLPPWKGEGVLSHSWVVNNLSTEVKRWSLPDFKTLQWVWYPEKENPEKWAPVGKRFFRKEFHFERAGRVIKEVSFLCAADNRFTLYLNGEEVGHGDSHRDVNLSRIRIELLNQTNVLAVVAENVATQDQPEGSPAGLIGHLVIRFEDESWITIPIDETWKTSDSELQDWKELACEPSGWVPVKVLGPLGMQPWNETRCAYPTVSPVTSSMPFVGKWSFPGENPGSEESLYYLCVDEIPLENALRLSVNGQEAGGLIGDPHRLEISRFLNKQGENEIRIEPFAPGKVEIKRIDRF